MQRKAAEGYQQASLLQQKVDGEDFIQKDVCPKAGDVILDLGCGTGELSAYLAELVGSEGKVIGVDPDNERIQLARESHKQVKNLSFVEGSASILPQTGLGPFDIIFSNYALHFMKNKKQVFNNMFNSLKAGGKIAISYEDCLPPFEFNAYMLMNPENGERISVKRCTNVRPKPRSNIIVHQRDFKLSNMTNFAPHLLLNPSRVL